MGLNKKSSNIQYVRLANGKFYLSDDKEQVNAFDELEGKLSDIQIRNEEFQGKKFRKVSLNLVDGEDTYIVSFPFDSSYTSTFTSFVKNVDVSQPITLVPNLKKEGDNERRALLIKQGDKFAKSFYTKDNPNGQPAFKKIKLNGEIKWDKTDFLEFVENVLLNEIKPNLGKKTTGGLKTGLLTPTPTPPVMSNGDDDYNDDLPF